VTIAVDDLAGRHWVVRRSLLHGRDGRGRRRRWRGPGPSWLKELRHADPEISLDAFQILDDAPIVGVVVTALVLLPVGREGVVGRPPGA